MSSLTRIDISCTILQKQEIQKQARKQGYPSVSAFMIDKAIGTEEPDGTPEPPEVLQNWLERNIPWSSFPPKSLSKAQTEFAISTGELRKTAVGLLGDTDYWVRGGGLYKVAGCGGGAQKAELVKALDRVSYIILLKKWCSVARLHEAIAEYRRVYQSEEFKGATSRFREKYGIEWLDSPYTEPTSAQRRALSEIQDLIMERLMDGYVPEVDC